MNNNKKQRRKIAAINAKTNEMVAFSQVETEQVKKVTAIMVAIALVQSSLRHHIHFALI